MHIQKTTVHFKHRGNKCILWVICVGVCSSSRSPLSVRANSLYVTPATLRNKEKVSYNSQYNSIQVNKVPLHLAQDLDKPRKHA